MAKDNISPEQKALLNLESKYRTRMWRIYNSAADEAAKLGIGIDAAELTEEMFSFENFPQTKKRINDILRNLHDDVQTNVISGAMASWQLANKKNDELVNAVFGDKVNKLTDAQKRQYFNNNSQALETFLSRKVNGMDLSKRVWNYTDIFKQNIEAVLDAGIREGKSASEMATSLKQYLKYPDKLFRRVRGEDGKLHLSKAAKAFHPGQGVYRSSYMNALRMSATENNIAYRTSDYLRIQGLDFVVGIRIRLSNNHTLKNPQGGAPLPLHDICDELQGIYPKTFKFTGWHPFCRCHQETVLKTEQEMNEDARRMLQGGKPAQGSSKAVNDVPAAFTDWISENKGRLSHAKNLPYFVRDNAKSFIPGVKFTKAGQSQIKQAAKLLETSTASVVTENAVSQKSALEIAKERHAARSQQQIDDIRKRWQLSRLPDNLTDSEKKAIIQNLSDMEKALGVKRGNAMTIEQADEQSANPNWGKRGYTINCQTCVPTYMLRLRGFDITAGPKRKGNLSDWISRQHSFDIWKNADGTPATPTLYNQWLKNKGLFMRMDQNTWKQFFDESCKDEGVYVVTIGWKGGGGHATIIQRFKDGTLSYIEPQVFNASKGVKMSINELINNANARQADTRGVMRIDNKIFDINYASIFKKGIKNAKR